MRSRIVPAILLLSLILLTGCSASGGGASKDSELPSVYNTAFSVPYAEDDLSGGYLVVSELEQAGGSVKFLAKNCSSEQSLYITGWGTIYAQIDGKWYYLTDPEKKDSHTVNASDESASKQQYEVSLEPGEEKYVELSLPNEFAYALDGKFLVSLFYSLGSAEPKQHWILLELAK